MLTLRRFYSNKYGTRGAWIREGNILLRVLEPEIPVIPAGDYVLNRFYSHHMQREVLRFETPGIPAFSQRCLEAHIGNCFHETEGCNLVGLRFGTVYFSASRSPEKRTWGDIPGILGSLAAYRKMMREIPNGTPIHVEGLR